MTLLGSAPGMAFMMKKKKYKFECDLNLEEMIEVPFLNAVLFAKIRLLDNTFQEISNREEVKVHTVKWGQHFQFPCKMSANASTGVLDPCLLRISIRKEIKGGRSYQKLGFVDLNLAEYAGQGLKSKKTILEGYDARSRQDNSMLLVTIKMHMISGDILFKVPSSKNQMPSEEDLDRAPIKSVTSQSQVAISSSGNSSVMTTTTTSSRQTTNSKDDASIASGSSGCGSLTKKNKSQAGTDCQPSIEIDPQSIVSSIIDSGFSDVSETPLVSTIFDRSSIHQGAVNSNTNLNAQTQQQQQQNIAEMGHSRNSSNTSQMSKGSGYSSSISERQHSRQSSDGDSGHTRYTRASLQKGGSLTSWFESQTREKMQHRRRESHSLKLQIIHLNRNQLSMCKSPESPSNDMYRTPNSTIDGDDDSGFDIFCTPTADITLMKMKSMNNLHDTTIINGMSLLRMKSLGHLNESHDDTTIDLMRLKRDVVNQCNDAKVEWMNNLNGQHETYDEIDGTSTRRHHSDNSSSPLPYVTHETYRLSLQTPKRRVGNTKYVGADSFSDSNNTHNYQLMKMHSMGTISDIVNNNMKSCDPFWNGKGNTVNGYSKKYDKRFIVPIKLEEKYSEANGNADDRMTNSNDDDVFKVPKTKEMVPLRKEKSSSCIDSMKNRGSSLYDRLRNSLHRRLLDGSPRMSTLNASHSPNDSSQNVTTDVSLSASINGDNFSILPSPMPSGTSSLIIRRPSSNMNPSSGSLQISETGSLDRATKAQAERRKKVYEDQPTMPGRVENTRVNPDKTIDELFATHKLEQLEEDAEPRGGLKLVIGRDGKAVLGNHETSQPRAFKHVLMDGSR